MGEGKGQEWKGVERLARKLIKELPRDAHTLAGVTSLMVEGDTFDEQIEKKLRERLEPLLEAAEETLRLHHDAETCVESLRKAVATWR